MMNGVGRRIRASDKIVAVIVAIEINNHAIGMVSFCASVVRTCLAAGARCVGAAALIVVAGGGEMGFGALEVWVAKKLTVRDLLGVSVVVRPAVFVLAVPRRVQRASRRMPACPACYGHRCTLPR